MAHNPLESTQDSRSEGPVEVTGPESALTEVPIDQDDFQELDYCEDQEQDPDQEREHDDSVVTDDEGLLAASERAPKTKSSGSRFAWVLVVLLLLAFAGSAALNWLQYEALTATQSENVAMTQSLEAATSRAEQAETAYADLRSLVDTVNQQIAGLQVHLSNLAILTQTDPSEFAEPSAKPSEGAP